jgi:hypothetical protein
MVGGRGVLFEPCFFVVQDCVLRRFECGLLLLKDSGPEAEEGGVRRRCDYVEDATSRICLVWTLKMNYGDCAIAAPSRRTKD